MPTRGLLEFVVDRVGRLEDSGVIGVSRVDPPEGGGISLEDDTHPTP